MNGKRKGKHLKRKGESKGNWERGRGSELKGKREGKQLKREEGEE